MANKHEDALRKLYPLNIEGVFDSDNEIEGKHLDAVNDFLETLSADIFGDTVAETSVQDFERVLAITPSAGDTLETRRGRIVAGLRALGGQTKQYYIDLLAALGETAAINEHQPFRVGVGRVGQRLFQQPDIVFAWNITFTGWTGNISQSVVEDMINMLKPAHTMVSFTYS